MAFKLVFIGGALKATWDAFQMLPLVGLNPLFISTKEELCRAAHN